MSKTEYFIPSYCSWEPGEQFSQQFEHVVLKYLNGKLRMYCGVTMETDDVDDVDDVKPDVQQKVEIKHGDLVNELYETFEHSAQVLSETVWTDCNAEGVHKCEKCEKVFSQSWRLKEHMVLHSNAKPFKCQLCPYAAKRIFSLRNHMRTTHSKPLHTKTKPKPHSCETCGARFRYKRMLNNHIRSHPEDKKHKCNDCGLKFFFKALLEKHIRAVHKKLKPFRCTYCEKDFSEKGNLDVHLRLHTGEKPYKCKSCDKSYRVKCSLLNHIQKAHSEG